MMDGRLAMGFILGGAASVLVALGALALIPERPARPMPATIVRVTYTIPNRWSLRAVVEFKGDDGRIGSDTILASALTCRVGDRVETEEVGINLRLRPGACRHTPPSPWAR